MSFEQTEQTSIVDILQRVRRQKWLLSVLIVTLTTGAAVAASLLPKQYEAIVIISPVSSTPGGQLGGLGSVASQFGGLAALAGISVSGDSRKSESIAVLQSEALTENFIDQNQLLPILFSKQWDSAKKTWRETDKTKIPTVWKANQLFKRKVRSVTTDLKTGLVTLTIRWNDPILAANWANGLVKMTNDYLRQKAIQESERNIAYLNSEAATTNVVEAKQAIYAVLQTELNKAMLARGSEEYAFKIIDPAAVPEKPASPQPLVWASLALFMSLVLSLFFAFIQSTWSNVGAKNDVRIPQ